MLRDGFLRFCDNPEIACCKAEAELGRLRQENHRLRAELLKSQRRERAAIADLEYIHCAGRFGCLVCHNNDICKRQTIQIGKCVDFKWRDTQESK
jgi:hypothetical protein